MLNTTSYLEQLVQTTKPVVAPPEEQTDVMALAQFMENGKGDNNLQLVSADGGTMLIPDSIFWILERVARLMSSGDAVSVVPVPQQVTIQQAADILNVSEDHVHQLLNDKQLSSIQTESKLQIRTGDVLAYKKDRDAKRMESLDELSRLSQEYGGYQELN